LQHAREVECRQTDRCRRVFWHPHP
jgi:hypothetical protein